MLTVYLILALIFTIIGFVGGALVTILWVERGKKTSEKPHLDEKSEPASSSIFLRLYDEQLELWVDGKPQREPNKLTAVQKSLAKHLFDMYKNWLGIENERQNDPDESTAIRQVDSFQMNQVVHHPESVFVRTPPAVSIVEQINAILQENIVEYGLDGKGIRLEEDSQQGVVIWVGMKKYQGVDEVPDPQVQAIIRSSVAEWEKRNEYLPKPMA